MIGNYFPDTEWRQLFSRAAKYMRCLSKYRLPILIVFPGYRRYFFGIALEEVTLENSISIFVYVELYLVDSTLVLKGCVPGQGLGRRQGSSERGAENALTLKN